MIDHSCSNEITHQLKTFILQQQNVMCIDYLKTRMFGEKYYVDLEIDVQEYLSLKQDELVTHKVHDILEKEFPDIKLCMIHINPHL